VKLIKQYIERKIKAMGEKLKETLGHLISKRNIQKK